MKIREGYTLKCIDGVDTVVCENGGKTVIPLSIYAAFLWRLLKKKQVTKSEMLDSLLNSFDISTVLALGEIDLFLRMMRENGIIE